MLSSLDDFRALFVQELVAAIGAEQLDLLAPKFLLVTIELAFAQRAWNPVNFCHSSSVTSMASQIPLDLLQPIQHRTVNKILKPGFLHSGFRHRDACLVGTLDGLVGVADHLGGNNFV